MNSGNVTIPLSNQPAALAAERRGGTAMNPGYFQTLLRVIATAFAIAILAACDDGRSTDNRRLLEGHPKARLEALRVQADMARNRLWALHGDGVHVYEITSRRLIGRVVLPEWIVIGWLFNCAPDLALHPSGTAVVSSNAQPVLWQLDPERFEVRRNELALDADHDKDVGFTGLAFADGLLFGVDGIHGSLWKVDLAAAKAQKVVLSSPLRGACGLASDPNAGPGRSRILCAIGEPGIRRIELSPDFAHADVTDQACP